MERRVAQRRIILLIFMNNAVKNSRWGFLTTQANGARQPWIGADNGLRAG
ncbi:hypothetical protein SDC9_187997 [bioreactor metagenome]|uniref:Uncharacterized protein n=1 Tax=bioreactor metagenome TaxID=1076179 RepID=A0A645HNQ0_9ZZZZ